MTEGCTDLFIVERWPGSWWLEIESHRLLVGPYKERSGAQAAMDREIALRLDAIARERAA